MCTQHYSYWCCGAKASGHQYPPCWLHWTSFRQKYYIPSEQHEKLDESTARRQLKSPRSLSGRSIHLTLVTKWSRSWSWMTYCLTLYAMSISPPILRYIHFKIWPWKSMVKVMCVVKGQGHVWPSNFKGQDYGQGQTHWSHLRPGVQWICLLFVPWQSDHFWLRYSKFHIWPWKSKVKVMAKAKPDGHIWGLGVQSICLLFVPWQSDHFWLRYNNVWPSNFKGQDYGQGQTHWSHLRPGVQWICLLFVPWQSDHFWLRYSKFHIWPWKSKVKVMAKAKPDGHIWGLGVQSICLLFVPWQSDHFWLRYNKFHIWPWKFKVKVMAKVTPDGHIWALEFYRYVCFSFRGNRTIFGWDIANSIFDLEKSRSRSRRKSTKI